VSAQAQAAAAPAARHSRDVARAEPDRWLLLFTLLLSGGGLVMVLSASQVLGYLQFRQPLYYFWRQAAGMLMGLAALLILRRVPYANLRIFARPAALLAVVLMLLVALPHVGMEVNGARRWFNLGVLGSFQPSEFGKLAFALFLADWLVRHEDRIGSFLDGFVPFAMLSSVGLALLMVEKDLGTGLVMSAMFAAMFYAAGGRTLHVVLLLAGLLLAFALFTLAEPYRLQRLAVFRDPFRDPLATGFQSVQALTALGSGGLTGIGLGHSVQKFLWLPAAHTDFIFAIIGEETGLVGTTAVLLGFFALATRGYRAAMRAPDRLGLTLAAGLTTWIAFQALINMATVTATLPVTGVPLPFISYGGTAVAVTLAAVGVLLNVAGQGSKRPYRRTHATVDFGRRHRRAPVSSPRRRASVSR
jgi:cell division protein FtsW